jgi:vitamin B12 transporter
MKTHRLIVAALAAAPVLLHAQQDSAQQDSPTPLEPVVVTATGHETPARDALAAIVVIPRAEIERAQATDIAELLRFHAGIELGRNGGPGGTTSVFVRGGESNHTLVLVDGVRVNPASSGGAALQNIAPDMIERIEIVKGPRATLYGSDAIAGVINIITRAAAAPAVELRARGGSYGTLDGGAFLAGGDGTSGIALHAQHLESDGFPPQPAETQDRGFSNSSVNARSRTRLGGIELGAQAWNTEGNSEYIGFGGPADQDFRNRVLALDAAATPREGWDTRVNLSHMLDEVEQSQSADFVRTERTGAGWHNVLAAGEGRHLSLGAHFAREKVRAALFGSPIEEDRDVLAAFAQYEISAGPQHALAALSATDHDAFGSQVNWNAEYGYDLASATRLVAAAGTGFRAPDATDRYGFGGNPELKPERALNYEVGVRQDVGTQQSVEVRLFRSEVEDLISVECVANCADTDPFNDTFQAVNVDEVRNRGAELSWRMDLADWSARLSLLKQDPRSAARPDPCSGTERLCRRADESVAASVVRNWGGHHLGVDLLGSGERADFGGTTLPGYALLNLTGGLQLGRLRLGARAENVLDKDYQTAAGFSQAGASFYVTAGWRL